MVRLRTFGTLELRHPHGAEIRAVIAQPRRVALLVYLAVATPRGFHRRDRLLALFWPENDAERARASLNRAIYFLRHELGEGILVSRGDEIGLDPNRFWCDAAALEDAIQRGEVREALDLYRGDLLPGFFASNAPEFEHWLEAERARLRERASEAAWALAEREETSGNRPLAAHWARRGVELAPLHELGLRRLLALLDRAGDRAAAAQAYKRFAGEIAAELELAPSPETRSLIEAIRARQEARADASPVVSDVGDARADPAAIAPTPVLATSHETFSSDVRPRRWWTRRWILTATVPVIALASISVVVTGPRSVDPTRVDVAAFENRTNDSALNQLGRVASQRIVAGLQQAALFKNVEFTETTRWRPWLRIPVRVAEVATLRKQQRPAIIVSGAITRRGGALTVEATITDARQGGRVWAVGPVSYPSGSADSAIDQVRARVIGGAAAISNPDGARFFPIASSPPTFEAYEEYREGLQLQARGQIAEAVSRFRWAAALDSSFTWALIDAAMADMNLGKEAQTDSIVELLAHARERLTPLQRNLMAYVVATRARDWGGSYSALSHVVDLAPERYAYRYAISASHVNRPREVVLTLSRPGLDTLYRNSTLFYWNVLTLAQHQLGDHHNELAAARRARAARPGSAGALTQEIRALAGLGRPEAVLARLDTLLSLPREGWFTPAWAMETAARELRAHGHPEAATEALHRAVAWHRHRPPDETVTEPRRAQLAAVFYLLGNLEEAEHLFSILAAGDTTSAYYLGSLGAIAARRGHRAEAEAIASRLRGLEHFIPLPGNDAVLARARIAALLGDHDRAMGLLTEAFGPAGTDMLHQDIDFEGMRADPRFREFIRPKG